MHNKIGQWLYTALYAVLLPAIVLRLLWRSLQQPRYRQHLLQRFGFYAVPAPTACGVWLHTVSVGEFLGVLPLILQILQKYPELAITITTTTATGALAVEKHLGTRVCHLYTPYDLPIILKRFLNFVKPRLLILMETELWPNVLLACERRQIPVLLINARMSKRSARRYARFAAVTRPMLARLTAVFAQYSQDAKRLAFLGVPRERIQVTGSIKFDTVIPTDLHEKSAMLRQLWGRERLILLAASTHPGEETVMLTMYQKLKQHWPQLLLVLVPRHPERCIAIADQCTQQTLTVVKRSDQRACTSDTDVFLGDTLGELVYFYAASDVAFVGGSFAAIGGHNLLEPALVGTPTIVGPHTFNFTVITRLLTHAGGVLIATNTAELETQLIPLLQDPLLRQQMGAQAKQCAKAHQGVLTKIVTLIEPYLRGQNIQ